MGPFHNRGPSSDSFVFHCTTLAMHERGGQVAERERLTTTRWLRSLRLPIPPRWAATVSAPADLYHTSLAMNNRGGQVAERERFTTTRWLRSLRLPIPPR